MSKPVDDVYLTWLYRRPSYELGQAVGMLKRFQELDFTYPKQFVYINVSLDMALQKKVGWKGGVGALALFKALGLFRLGDCHRGNCEDRLQFLTSFAFFFFTHI